MPAIDRPLSDCRYEIPSGGDWAIHRGGAVFADGAESVVISGNRFDQIDGNGVFLSRYARNFSVKANDMVAIGDSGILVVGASGSGMVDNSRNRNYPAYNVIEENHIDTVGVWVKQTAAYFKSVTRGNNIRNNVFHDGPRSGARFCAQSDGRFTRNDEFDINTDGFCIKNDA